MYREYHISSIYANIVIYEHSVILYNSSVHVDKSTSIAMLAIVSTTSYWLAILVYALLAGFES